MATKAFVNVTHVDADLNPAKGNFVSTVCFFGDGVTAGDAETQGPHTLPTNVTITSSSVQLKNQIINDVIAFAATKGLTVGNGDVILGSLEIV